MFPKAFLIFSSSKIETGSFRLGYFVNGCRKIDPCDQKKNWKISVSFSSGEAAKKGQGN